MKSYRRVLIVDDDDTFDRTLSQYLKVLDYEIVGVAHDREEAIEMAIEKDPDIIFMDIKLPDADEGIALAKEFQKVIACKLIYVTGLNGQETFRKASQETSFVDYLLKPISFSRLKESLHKIESDQVKGYQE
ncbi:MAG: response regulator [Bacteroidota bacterium]